MSQDAPPYGFSEHQPKPGPLLGASPPIRELLKRIAEASQSGQPVLIYGENGTGKRAAARSIHVNGPLAGQPFLTIDCGSPAWAQLGRRRAGDFCAFFAGAAETAGNQIESRGGTLFLNQVADLPAESQARVLRILERNRNRPQTGSPESLARVRLVAATSRNLEAAVGRGAFRRDLFERLAALTIALPPLREHKSDIPELVSHFLESCSLGRRPLLKVSDEAMRLLMAYDWPGNVRELENYVARAATLGSGNIIYSNDLPSPLHNAVPCGLTESEAAAISPRQLEKRALLRAVDKSGGNKLRAAEMLGIGRSTLYRKLKQRQGALTTLLKSFPGLSSLLGIFWVP